MNFRLQHHIAFTIAMLIGFSQLSMATAQSTSSPLKKNGLEAVVEVPDEIAPGESFDFELKLSVPSGFHIYGSKDSTMPTELTLNETDGVSFSDPDIPAGTFHAKSGMTNYWLEGEQTLRTKVTVADSVEGEVKLSGHLKFMICTDQVCKPPAKLPFEVIVAVKAESKAEASSAESSLFEPAVRLEADGKIISTEEPGYASPCLADVDGDGKKDLLVGQFNGGKIKVYSGLGNGKFSKGKWLKAGGEVAEVPGVW